MTIDTSPREGAASLAATSGKAHAEALTRPNREQGLEVLRNPNALEESDGHLRVQIDQGIDVASLKMRNVMSHSVSAMSLGYNHNGILLQIRCRLQQMEIGNSISNCRPVDLRHSISRVGSAALLLAAVMILRWNAARATWSARILTR